MRIRLDILRSVREIVISQESWIILCNHFSAAVIPLQCSYLGQLKDNNSVLPWQRLVTSIIEGNTISKSQVNQTFSWTSLQLLTDCLECCQVLSAYVAQHLFFFPIEFCSTGVNITRRGLLQGLSLREHPNTKNRFTTKYRNGAELWNTLPFYRIRRMKIVLCTVHVKLLTPSTKRQR